MSILAALLDRSVAQIGELAADGRNFDRQTVVEIADVWDNNTIPLFRTALCRPSWLRERRAKAALVWMADPSPSRRAWMITQAAVAGHRLEPMLPRNVEKAVHHRDYQGRIWPGIVPLTTAAVAVLAQDYDLARAEARTVRVERAGQQLCGYLALAAPRRYAAPGENRDAVVRLFLDDVRTVWFDSDDRTGVSLAAEPTGVEIRVGIRGCFRAVSAALWLDDESWHLSHAGRAADAYTPRSRPTLREPRRARWPTTDDAAWEAALVVHQAMLQIRSVRYAKLVGRASLAEMCGALAGAGERVLTAAGQPRATRDRAFRKLVEEWITESPNMAHWIAHRGGNAGWVRALARTVSVPPAVAAGLPPQAQLTLASFTASHVEFGAVRDASAVVNLAVPDGDAIWGLRGVEFERPTRWTLTTAAFGVPHVVSYTADVSLSLGNGVFAVTCRERDSAVVE